ncbi:MAG: ParA family protein [Prevotellaceae bacterium]|nr:ParA family protein [Prevotellaceae bacterium]
MCRVIAIANDKAGVGKTTTTHELAEAFARRGVRARVINADPMQAPDLIEFEMSEADTESKWGHFRSVADSMRDECDVILIDCPSSLGMLTSSALAAADEVVIPVRCECKATEGLARLLNQIKTVKATRNPALKINGILLTMADERLRLTVVVYAELKAMFGDKLFETVIRRGHLEDYDVLASEIGALL